MRRAEPTRPGWLLNDGQLTGRRLGVHQTLLPVDELANRIEV